MQRANPIAGVFAGLLGMASAWGAADGPVDHAQQPLINGLPIPPALQRELGLVGLSLGCSGTLLNDRWVLTAGHCFGQNVARATTVTLNTDTVAADLIYVMGAETDASGKSWARGYDMALVRLAAPMPGVAGLDRAILNRPTTLTGQRGIIYGRGVQSFFRPGPPPVAPASDGTFRGGAFTVTSMGSGPKGFPGNIVNTIEPNGPACAPGDSGGPVFMQRADGQLAITAVLISGQMKCAIATQGINACKATLTAVTSCQANLIDERVIRGIMASPWDPQLPAQTLQVVGNELTQYLFFDPDGINDTDLNVRGWSVTARAANEMCANRGFVGGFLDGQQRNGNVGLVCVGPGAVWRDAITADMTGLPWAFKDTDRTPWALARRAAQSICGKYGFVGGYFNGHQAPGFQGEIGKWGLICVGAPAKFYDASPAELRATGSPVDDVNAVAWAQGARAAATFCSRRHFATGFLTGHQLPGKTGVICLQRAALEASGRARQHGGIVQP